MMALVLAYALATESSEASPAPLPGRAAATAGLLVVEVQALSARAPAHGAFAAEAPAVLRVAGRGGQAYRIRLRPTRRDDWAFDDLKVVSRARGDVTASGMAVLDAEGADELRVTGTLRRRRGADEPAQGASWPRPILARFGIDYE